MLHRSRADDATKFPDDCRAKDISNYRIALLRATSRTTQRDKPRGAALPHITNHIRRDQQLDGLRWTVDVKVATVVTNRRYRAPAKSAASGGNECRIRWKCAMSRCALAASAR